MSEIPADVQALIDKARSMQAKVEECERAGGHDYRVHGLSLIAHPDAGFPPFRPVGLSVTKDIIFSSYYCPRCGNRVAPEEARAYMAKKRLNEYVFGDGDGTYSWLL